MRERPILMQGDMVRAVLAGLKTQTRRIAHIYDVHLNDEGWPIFEDEFGDWLEMGCPHGEPGDRLWVRETFCMANCGDFLFRADGEQGLSGLWKPSIHMPRRASRILLEITNIRVERVQDISEEDAKAEGVERHWDEGVTYYGPFDNGHASPSYEFRRLWDSINGNRIDKKTKKRLPYAWKDNPWVWVIEFKILEVKGGQS